MIDVAGRVQLVDIGMGPIHFIEQPRSELRRHGAIYNLFAAPEIPREREQFIQVTVASSADIFAMGMLFLFLLVPITENGEPSSDFCALAKQIHDGKAPIALPDCVVIKEPMDLVQMLWALIRSMVVPQEYRPDSARVCDQLAPVGAYLRVLSL